ncbi:MAG: helix-turn-helix transcriptional regulator [Bacteroidales bacterium]|jgi:transcriptional regulator with XRE-family HTH domain|nr:helix-turn-helix transcriptional regulator [Bacteroidales bacterium]
MDFRDILKKRRMTLNISQVDLAEKAEVSLATVKDIERGKGNPSLQTIRKLLAVLGMEIEYKIKNLESKLKK